MKPFALVIDDFYPEFESLRKWADTAKFEDTPNPKDGLMYPTCITLEADIGIQPLLENVFGCRILLDSLIVRLNTKGCPVEYAAHADAFMGSQYTMVLYLTRDEFAQGGTTLCRHESGIERWLDPPQQVPDHSDLSKWETLVHCPMKANRVFVFPSDQLHYASPGFGSDNQDGRMVLVGLFRLGSMVQ
jgi:hypothetical protein